MTGAAFLSYVEQVAPTLEPGETVTCLPESAGVRAVVEATGARMRLLPPYSPDVNPIENAFAKLKALLCNAAARTIPDLWDAIRDALPQFTPEECANYFTACGYEPEWTDSALEEACGGARSPPLSKLDNNLPIALKCTGGE